MAITRVFDLKFETDHGVALFAGHGAQFSTPRPAREPDGWGGSDGPGIAPETWPRDPVCGLPMNHGVTLRLPEEYRRKGPDLVGVSFFQSSGDGPRATPDPDSSDPFLVDLAAYRPHPHLSLRRDIIGGYGALVWLTEEELGSGPRACPPDPRGPDAWIGYGVVPQPSPWTYTYPTTRIWLVERADPNAGRAPRDYPWGQTEFGPGEYVPIEALDDQFGRGIASHLGGTVNPSQHFPPGMTLWYLELFGVAGTNFGDGSGQIDLESDYYDWQT